MSMTAELAAFCEGFSLGMSPPDLVTRAKEAFLDSLGVMIAGSREQSSLIAARWVREHGGQGCSSVFALGGFRTSHADAALVNGVAAHAIDFDHFGHQSAVILPCVLAVGEALSSSGRDVLEAYIVGVETSALLARGLDEHTREMGFHPASICGSLGAATAAARLIGLDRQQVQVVLGIAASMSSGLTQNFGTMVKPLHLGMAARNGIMAAELASMGFTANADILDADGGFFTKLQVERVPEGLGKRYSFLDPGIAIKAYPCPYSSQRAVEAAVRLAQRYDLKPQDVEQINCLAAPGTFRVLIHHNPSSPLEAKFSLEYLLAVAVSMRTIREELFDISHLRDPEVQRLARRVRIVDAAKSKETPGVGEVTIQIRVYSGELYQETVTHAPGHPKNPLNSDRLTSKYTDCVRWGRLGEQAAARSLGMLTHLEDLNAIQQLCETIVPEARNR